MDGWMDVEIRVRLSDLHIMTRSPGEFRSELIYSLATCLT